MNLNRLEELVLKLEKSTDKIIDETKTGLQKNSDKKLSTASRSFSIFKPLKKQEAK